MGGHGHRTKTPRILKEIESSNIIPESSLPSKRLPSEDTADTRDSKLTKHNLKRPTTTNTSVASPRAVDEAHPRTLRKRKFETLYDMRYHPMDSVLRPASKVTLLHRDRSTQPNIETDTEKATEDSNEKIAQQQIGESDEEDQHQNESHLESENLLCINLPSTWKDVSIFDLRLHALLGGGPASRTWHSISQILIKDGFFTEEAFRQQGGQTRLAMRYNFLRTIFKDQLSGNQPHEEPKLSNSIFSILKGNKQTIFEAIPGSESQVRTAVQKNRPTSVEQGEAEIDSPALTERQQKSSRESNSDATVLGLAEDATPSLIEDDAQDLAGDDTVDLVEYATRGLTEHDTLVSASDNEAGIHEPEDMISFALDFLETAVVESQTSPQKGGLANQSTQSSQTLPETSPPSSNRQHTLRSKKFSSSQGTLQAASSPAAYSPYLITQSAPSTSIEQETTNMNYLLSVAQGRVTRTGPVCEDSEDEEVY